MSSCRDWTVAALLGCAAATAQSDPYPGVGRPATPKELTAWDIDVRPDFKGLPTGSGSVADGQGVWDSKCASCHGVFGESNEVFHPLVGGTSKEDAKTGRVAALTDGSFPGRTTLMKLSTLSTLWDYINRAMPWTQPKSLSVAEVYGVTAYMLNLGGIVPDDFVLSERNIVQVQKLLPNRNGMTLEHGLWPGKGPAKGVPDVKAAACLKDCGGEPQVASALPDFARDAHGNLAQQNRPVGAQRGADTSEPAAASPQAAAAPRVARAAAAAAPPGAATRPASPPAAPPAASNAGAAIALTQKYTCVACHGMDNKGVGPSFRDIAKKHAGRADATGYLAAKVKAGSAGVWGAVPMPPQALGAADARVIAQWLADGARK